MNITIIYLNKFKNIILTIYKILYISETLSDNFFITFYNI